ncbi:MAG: DUF2656 domain-containing protein [Xenococcaceae cyanobacterium MO_188.B29]|nr:DUF2656 domain-containing protein [Xenococcaceae cyanobacterium MO_188.B29]
MSNPTTGRMLLSHNFELKDNIFPQFSREKFAQVFIDGFQDKPNIACSSIDNPHWMVEIIFPSDEFSADKIGQFCAKILEQKRKSQKPDNVKMPDILILGGKKTTPPISDSPTSLQPGEWGVDVVETASADSFLTDLNWDERVKDKPIDRVFKIEIKGE